MSGNYLLLGDEATTNLKGNLTIMAIYISKSAHSYKSFPKTLSESVS